MQVPEYGGGAPLTAVQKAPAGQRHGGFVHLVLSVFGSLLFGGSVHIIAQFEAPLLPCRSSTHNECALAFKYDGTGGQATSGFFLLSELQLGEQKFPFTSRNAIGD